MLFLDESEPEEALKANATKVELKYVDGSCFL